MGARRILGFALMLAAASIPPSASADPVLVAGGDVACAPGDANFGAGNGTLTPAPGFCHQRYTADLIEGIAPLHLLALGDLQYEDGALSRFNASYAPSWGRPGIKEITKPVPGNHEYGQGGTDNDPDTVNADANATGYFTFFADQLAAEGPDAGNPRKGWYSYDVPVGSAPDGSPFRWHVVALNSECAAGLRNRPGFNWEGGCAAGSDQEQWLRRDLAADGSTCTLAYWHHPRFSSGGTGDNPIMAPIWNALYDDRATIVLNGHDHDYERFAQQGPSAEAAPGRGIREFVVGTGGENLLEGGLAPSPRSEIYREDVYGVLKLTLHGPEPAHPSGWYEWEFVDDGHSGNDLEDRGAADCVGAPFAFPAAASGSGVAAPARPAVADREAPVLTRVGLDRTRFRVGPRSTAVSARTRVGTAFRYRLSEPATVALAISRRVRRRGRLVYVPVRTLSRRSRAGARRVPFSGRIRRRALKPGRYRVSVRARDTAGNRSPARVAGFTILAR